MLLWIGGALTCCSFSSLLVVLQGYSMEEKQDSFSINKPWLTSNIFHLRRNLLEVLCNSPSGSASWRRSPAILTFDECDLLCQALSLRVLDTKHHSEIEVNQGMVRCLWNEQLLPYFHQRPLL